MPSSKSKAGPEVPTTCARLQSDLTAGKLFVVGSEHKAYKEQTFISQDVACVRSKANYDSQPIKIPSAGQGCNGGATTQTRHSSVLPPAPSSTV